MLVLVEGPRNVGKTFLLEAAGMETYKFPFATIDQMSESGEFFSGGLSIGKDLQLLHLNAAELLDSKLILVDRSIVSTIVYGSIFGRFSNTYIMKLFAYMKEQELLKNLKVIHVIGENPIPRPPKDESKYEELTYQAQWGTFKNTLMLLSANCGLKYHTFVNKFDGASVKKFTELMETIYEY